jgi:hypothetical protein
MPKISEALGWPTPRLIQNIWMQITSSLVFPGEACLSSMSSKEGMPEKGNHSKDLKHIMAMAAVAEVVNRDQDE